MSTDPSPEGSASEPAGLPSLKYVDVCSGISAPTAAWKPLGWKALCYAEIEAFPSAVLKHHYPDVDNRGDFTTIGDEYRGAADVLVGGTPCQSFSVAGLRGGLADDRGNLALEFLRLAGRTRPRWLVWENVPGVLSSGDGRDFGSILGGLVELGYGFAYRVFDAQYAGVPQRRRRIFVVGHTGDWRRAAAVLFEFHCLQGNTPPSREAWQAVAGTFKSCAGSGGWSNSADHAAAGYMQPVGARSGAIRGRDGTPQAELGDEVANAVLTPNGGRGGIGVGAVLAHSLRADGFDASEGGTGRGTPLVPIVAPCLTQSYGKQPDNSDTSAGPMLLAIQSVNMVRDKKQNGIGIRDGEAMFTLTGRDQHAVAFAQNTRDEVREMDVVGAIAAEPGMKQTSYIRQSMAVRRLTPLQGFTDDYTLIPYRGKLAADGPRYKALGNSMAVPVVRWIGERIQKVDQL